MSSGPDPKWPSAASLLLRAPVPGRTTVALVGVPTFTTALSPWTRCDTPTRVREALARYSTWSYRDSCDLLDEAVVVDLGDVDNPDDGPDTVAAVLAATPPDAAVTAVIGGDNAATFQAMTALAGADLAQWGLVTIDAHHDLRDGTSNGSPVRQLLDAGLPGTQVVQVGISDFANSPAYALRARTAGITVCTRAEIHQRGIAAAIRDAVIVAGGEDRPVYVDVDLDVCDRSVVPACPAAAPGGLSADELRTAVYTAATMPLVRAIDFTEVDSDRDDPGMRTTRLVALALLELVAGTVTRGRP